jgi:hypothetical protein
VRAGRLLDVPIDVAVSCTATATGERLPGVGQRSAAASPFQIALLLHRSLSGGQRDQALLRDQLTAVDREPIRTGGKTLLGTLDSGEPVAKISGETFVELI